MEGNKLWKVINHENWKLSVIPLRSAIVRESLRRDYLRTFADIQGLTLTAKSPRECRGLSRTFCPRKYFPRSEFPRSEFRDRNFADICGLSRTFAETDFSLIDILLFFYDINICFRIRWYYYQRNSFEGWNWRSSLDEHDTKVNMHFILVNG